MAMMRCHYFMQLLGVEKYYDPCTEILVSGRATQQNPSTELVAALQNPHKHMQLVCGRFLCILAGTRNQCCPNALIRRGDQRLT